MIHPAPLPDFLADPTAGPILDVRAPAEFTHGHIPGAVSFPLFSDDERARIGEAYRSVMGSNYPAMTLVGVTSLVDPDARVEIEATAVVPADAA